VQSESLHQDLADELWQADRHATSVAPLTDRHPDLALDDAYAIQTINIERRTSSGERVIGRKVGLTSRPMQEMLGVDEPDFGVLTDRMMVEDGDLIALDALVQPRVEAELQDELAGRDLAKTGNVDELRDRLVADDLK
jgi:2-keto-4-pentenoate hydratase